MAEGDFEFVDEITWRVHSEGIHRFGREGFQVDDRQRDA